MKTQIVIQRMNSSRLMENAAEVSLFRDALEALIDLPKSEELFRQAIEILDDNCAEPEILFGLMQYLEEYGPVTFLESLPGISEQVKTRAQDWLGSMFNRMLNNPKNTAVAKTVFADISPSSRQWLQEWIKTNANIKSQYRSFFDEK